MTIDIPATRFTYPVTISASRRAVLLCVIYSDRAGELWGFSFKRMHFSHIRS